MDSKTKELFALAREGSLKMRSPKPKKQIEEAFNFDVPNRFHKMGFKKGVKTAHKILGEQVCSKCKRIVAKELEKFEKEKGK